MSQNKFNYGQQSSSDELVALSDHSHSKKKDHIKKKDKTNFMIKKDIIIHNKHEKQHNDKHPQPMNANAGVESEKLPVYTQKKWVGDEDRVPDRAYKED